MCEQPQYTSSRPSSNHIHCRLGPSRKNYAPTRDMSDVVPRALLANKWCGGKLYGANGTVAYEGSREKQAMNPVAQLCRTLAGVALLVGLFSASTTHCAIHAPIPVSAEAFSKHASATCLPAAWSARCTPVGCEKDHRSKSVNT